MAMLAHVLQLFSSFIAPLIIFIVKRDSPFVRFHALQALLWKILEMMIMFGSFIVVFALIFATLPTMKPGPNQPPPPFIFFFPLIWVGGLAGWLVSLIFAILYGIRSYEGAWSRYPILGKLAMKWSGVQPATNR